MREILLIISYLFTSTLHKLNCEITSKKNLIAERSTIPVKYDWNHDNNIFDFIQKEDLEFLPFDEITYKNILKRNLNNYDFDGSGTTINENHSTISPLTVTTKKVKIKKKISSTTHRTSKSSKTTHITRSLTTTRTTRSSKTTHTTSSLTKTRTTRSSKTTHTTKSYRTTRRTTTRSITNHLKKLTKKMFKKNTKRTT